MREYCTICRKTLNSHKWKSIDVINGKVIWICGKHFKASNPEFVPDSIKQDRAKYAKSLIQPWRKGEASREFMELYPKQSAQMYTTKEKATAKYVWRDQPGYSHLKKTH